MGYEWLENHSSSSRNLYYISVRLLHKLIFGERQWKTHTYTPKKESSLKLYKASCSHIIFFKSVIKETRYQASIAELFTRDLKSQIEVLVGKPNTYHLLYFSGDHEFLQNSPGKKSLYHRGGKVIPLKPIEK